MGYMPYSYTFENISKHFLVKFWKIWWVNHSCRSNSYWVPRPPPILAFRFLTRSALNSRVTKNPQNSADPRKISLPVSHYNLVIIFVSVLKYQHSSPEQWQYEYVDYFLPVCIRQGDKAKFFGAVQYEIFCPFTQMWRYQGSPVQKLH